MTGVLIKRGNLITETDRANEGVKTEFEIQLPANEHQRLLTKHPNLERGKEESFPFRIQRDKEGSWPYQHLDFRLLASRTVRK